MLITLYFLFHGAYFIVWLPLILKLIKSAAGQQPSWSEWKWPLATAIWGTVGISILGWLVGDVYTEASWFTNLGYTSVFWTMFRWKWTLFLIFAGLTFGLLKLNARIARKKASPIPTDYEKDYGEDWELRTNLLSWGMTFLALLVAIAMGFWALGQWETVLLYVNQATSSTTDPIFGHSISFYLFSLPMYRFICNWFVVLLILILIEVVGVQGFYYARTKSLTEEQSTKAAKTGIVHGALILAALFVVLVWRAQLARYEILYSPGGAVFGATYTDIHAQLLACWVFTGILPVAAGLLVAGALRANFKMLLGTLGGVVVLLIIFFLALPGWIQRFEVAPNELAVETPYIKHNIEFTRAAYKLTRMEEKQYQVQMNLSLEDIGQNQDTIDNIRLWDWRALHDTYKQSQAIRLYYEFQDVDIDRYHFNGTYREVMLSARELFTKELPSRSQTWLNKKLKYTHGYGVVLNTVNEFGPSGLPNLLVKDIPPVSSFSELEVQRPEIYYGELTNRHIFVNTAEKEFDYPKGEKNVYTNYQGSGGVALGRLRKFALSLRFDGLTMLFSRSLGPDSRIMFHRSIQERAHSIAPFLVYDKDPYIVLAEGKLWWVQDAYTISNDYPYSEPYIGYPGQFDRLNYIRNSVKVVIDAYTGDTKFYIFDEKDIILQTYQNIFPQLFLPGAKMPSSLRTHIRYPKDIFEIQARIYSTYHMRDPQVFYNKEDLWVLANETYIGNVQRVTPYYVLIRLPGEEKLEFIQMVPFTPSQKNNMIGWMAGRCDGENYGKLLVYKLPKETYIPGTMQVESWIDQATQMSEKLTLWSQRGSEVIRANLLTIPIQQNFLYVEPIFLQAERAKFPQLKRVIVSIGKDGVVVWSEDLDRALQILLSEKYLPEEPEKKKKEKIPSVGLIIKKVKEIQQQLEELLNTLNEWK